MEARVGRGVQALETSSRVSPSVRRKGGQICSRKIIIKCASFAQLLITIIVIAFTLIDII